MDWPLFWHHAWHMLVAFGLVLPIGWNREKETRSAGIRTFPLVAIAACGFMLLGLSAFDAQDAQARVLYGIITGIGFIGGGAILKDDGKSGSVSGTATAASLWNAGAIGAAVAFDHFAIAILLAVINLVLLQLKDAWKEHKDE